MTVELVKEGRVTRLNVPGKLDLENSTVIGGEVRRGPANGDQKFLLDMTGVEFMNSSGLGAPVTVLKEVRLAEGQLALCELAPYVQELFEVTQLKKIFDLHPSHQEAIDARSALPDKNEALRWSGAITKSRCA